MFDIAFFLWGLTGHNLPSAEQSASGTYSVYSQFQEKNSQFDFILWNHNRQSIPGIKKAVPLRDSPIVSLWSSTTMEARAPPP